MVRLTVSTLLCSSVGWSACSLDVRLLHAVTTLFVFPDVNHASGFVQRSVWYVSRRTVAGRWGRRLVRRTVGTFSIRRAGGRYVGQFVERLVRCLFCWTDSNLFGSADGRFCMCVVGWSVLLLVSSIASHIPWFAGRMVGCSVNSSHSWISMHILHTFLHIFPMVLTWRICLTIKSFSCRSFPLFS